MRKKIYILISIIIYLFGGIKPVLAEGICTKEAVEEMAKIIFHEYNSDKTESKDLDFFARMTVASVILNNTYRDATNYYASDKTIYDVTYKDIYDLPNRRYEGHSKYKDNSLESEVTNKNKRGEFVYISALVLSGKYNVPYNLIGQGSCACTLGDSHPTCKGVDKGLEAYNCKGGGWAKEWTHVKNPKGFDTYFGYDRNETLSTKDVFNRTVSTDVDYYKKLAAGFRKDNFENYTPENACQIVSGISSNISGNNSGSSNSTNTITYEHVCENPEILKVIQFFLIIFDAVKIIVPIALIVIGTIDFSKSVTTSDETVQKKSIQLLGKRILYAILIFAVPWIVEVIIESLGNLTKDVNFTDCLTNANKNKIQELQDKYDSKDSSNSNNQNSNNNANTNNNYNYIIYIGDSRTTGMCSTVTLGSNENCTVAKVGMGYDWLNSDSTKNKINDIITNHPNSYIVINMGTNSSLTSEKGKEYAKLYNELAAKYPNSKVIAVSVTQVDAKKAKQNGLYPGVSIDDNSVSNFNNGLRSSLNSSVSYCDVYSKMQNYNYTATDGVHYNSDTYKFIYDEMQKCLK